METYGIDEAEVVGCCGEDPGCFWVCDSTACSPKVLSRRKHGLEVRRLS